MIEFAFTIGVSGSGKTTTALKLCNEHNWLRFNRDELRATLTGKNLKEYWMQSRDDITNVETIITNLEYAFINSCIENGRNGIFDSTNLKPSLIQKTIEYIQGRAKIKPIFTHSKTAKKKSIIDFHSTIDSHRGDFSVGREVIEKQATQFKNNLSKIEQLFTNPIPEVIFSPQNYNDSKKDMIIIDIDDTFIFSDHRQIHETWKMKDDKVRWQTINLLNNLNEVEILFLTARTKNQYHITKQQLNAVLMDTEINWTLKTRDVENYDEPAYIFKERFIAQLMSEYNIVMILDDNEQTYIRLKNKGLPIYRA